MAIVRSIGIIISDMAFSYLIIVSYDRVGMAIVSYLTGLWR